jgi:hypothetical protein
MVGDDQVHTAASSGLGSGKSTNAGIYADDEAHSPGSSPLDDIVFEAVALADTVRHVKIGLPAAELNGSLQNDNGNRAINVVVTIDEHGLALHDSALYAFHYGFHAAHQVGRV